jgi:thiosulfate dehydrogenase [quinone] large subunit
MSLSHKQIAYALLRVSLGINFFGHGFFRILSGIPAFAHTTADHLSKSPIPYSVTLGFAYAIPIIELLLGLALIAGLFTRVTLAAGAVFMMALTIGVTSNQQWEVAGQQLLYCLIFFVLLFLAEHNALAVDAFRRRTPLQ